MKAMALLIGGISLVITAASPLQRHARDQGLIAYCRVNVQPPSSVATRHNLWAAHMPKTHFQGSKVSVKEIAELVRKHGLYGPLNTGLARDFGLAPDNAAECKSSQVSFLHHKKLTRKTIDVIVRGETTHIVLTHKFYEEESLTTFKSATYYLTSTSGVLERIITFAKGSKPEIIFKIGEIPTAITAEKAQSDFNLEMDYWLAAKEGIRKIEQPKTSEK